MSGDPWYWQVYYWCIVIGIGCFPLVLIAVWLVVCAWDRIRGNGPTRDDEGFPIYSPRQTDARRKRGINPWAEYDAARASDRTEPR